MVSMATMFNICLSGAAANGGSGDWASSISMVSKRLLSLTINTVDNDSAGPPSLGDEMMQSTVSTCPAAGRPADA